MRLWAIPLAIAYGVALAVAQPAPVTRDAGVDARAADAGIARTAVDAGATPATSPPGPPDAGMRRMDAGSDARAPDASLPPPIDAGVPPSDARTSTSASTPLDAGASAPLDAGASAPPDAGTLISADTPVDAISGGAVPIEPNLEAEVFQPVIEPAAESPPELTEPVDTGFVAAEPEGPPASAKSTLFAIKVILGLIVLVALAYAGGHRKVVRIQERLGLSGLITAGFPFVALGLIASLPSVGILTGDVLGGLRPMLQFGLGWLGFIIGAQLDIRVLDRVPKGTAYLILVEALAPFAVTAAACGAVMFSFGLSWHDPEAWRDIVLLGVAAAMTAPRKFRGFANRTWHEGRGVDVLLGQLDELVGVIGLLFISAYFRDTTNASWQIPNTAWVFVSLGLGVTIGALIFAMVRVPQSNVEFLAVVLGGISFASGLASYLHLSPIVVCFLAGVLVTNFPNDQRESIFRILNHLERPVQLLFLIIAGALWDVGDWRGWALVPLFVVGRVVGKWTGVLAGRTVVAEMPAGFATQRPLIVPMSSLAIALVISVGGGFVGTGLTWVITAVIGGAIVTELLVQKIGKDPDPVLRTSSRQIALPEPVAHAEPIDELEDDGPDGIDDPIYGDDAPGPEDKA